jgi:hypothetical protein
MLTPEWLSILHELEHPDGLQQTLAAVYLFSTLPVMDLAHCTQAQLERIAKPVKGPNG